MFCSPHPFCLLQHPTCFSRPRTPLWQMQEGSGLACPPAPLQCTTLRVVLESPLQQTPSLQHTFHWRLVPNRIGQLNSLQSNISIQQIKGKILYASLKCKFKLTGNRTLWSTRFKNIERQKQSHIIFKKNHQWKPVLIQSKYKRHQAIKWWSPS